ncbi:MAG: hypothetical protein KY468_03125 [Armatimonadetes bacterium]|nr:hypothetical protein [Armatimonadota bacterium]
MRESAIFMAIMLGATLISFVWCYFHFPNLPDEKKEEIRKKQEETTPLMGWMFPLMLTRSYWLSMIVLALSQLLIQLTRILRY